jgi:hypothetical protein
MFSCKPWRGIIYLSYIDHPGALAALLNCSGMGHIPPSKTGRPRRRH